MDLKVEIFAVGKWNGMTFDVEDLDSMASSFEALKDVHQPALKFGHNKEQPFTDGQPALGWINKVMVEGNKLFANFTDMPKIVYDAMKAKLYKNVSIELDMEVEHKGSSYAYVLSGVALLGADLPAVNTLADLTNYMSRNSEITFKKRVAFTAINIKSKTKEFSMNELEMALAKIAKLEATNEAQATSINTFSTDKVNSDVTIAKFEAQVKADELAAEKLFFATAKTDMTDKLETLVKSETITPAQRENFMSKFEDDKSKIESLNFTLDILSAGKEGTKGMDKDDTTKIVDSKDEGKQPDEVLMSRMKAVQEKDPKMSFSTARNLVMQADTELADAYVNMNGVA